MSEVSAIDVSCCNFKVGNALIFLSCVSSILVLATLLAAPATPVTSVWVTTVPMMVNVGSIVMTTASTSVVSDGAGKVVGMMRKSVSMNVTRIAPETVKMLVTKEVLLC